MSLISCVVLPDADHLLHLTISMRISQSLCIYTINEIDPLSIEQDEPKQGSRSGNHFIHLFFLADPLHVLSLSEKNPDILRK